jgi:serine/threonine protein kinase
MFETLGHYKILDRIGAGGIGEVYRARDTRLGRTVAIKVLKADIADEPNLRARFLQDARAASALSHPNIAALYEIGEDQDRLFLVFEYVPGETLKHVIAGRPLNPRRAIDRAVQVADALADAHAHDIIHRNITSDDIIITPKGNAKILDFGLAAWTAAGAESDQAAYMSPEQALGEPVDHRTDIFSLGIVMFEMLTGRLPFGGATPAEVAQMAQSPAPAPSAVNKSVPAELDAIVGSALARNADQRCASAATLASELRSIGAVLDERSETQQAAVSFSPVRPRRRSVGGWIALLLIFAALCAAAWFGRAWLL